MAKNDCADIIEQFKRDMAGVTSQQRDMRLRIDDLEKQYIMREGIRQYIAQSIMKLEKAAVKE